MYRASVRVSVFCVVRDAVVRYLHAAVCVCVCVCACVGAVFWLYVVI